MITTSYLPVAFVALSQSRVLIGLSSAGQTTPDGGPFNSRGGGNDRSRMVWPKVYPLSYLGSGDRSHVPQPTPLMPTCHDLHFAIFETPHSQQFRQIGGERDRASAVNSIPIMPGVCRRAISALACGLSAPVGGT